MTAVNIFVFSLVNGAMRFTPGGIPAAWGFHFAWNSLQVLCGASMTGENFGIPLVSFISREPVWLSGGLYGPEGSIAATLVTAAGVGLIWKYLKSGENPASC